MLERITLENEIAILSEFQVQSNASLPTYREGSVQGFSQSELNEAIDTVFAELTAAVHTDSKLEAKAIASTIFNRLNSINEARQKLQSADAEVKAKQAESDEAKKSYEDYTNKQSASKKLLKNQGLSQVEVDQAFKVERDRLKKEYKDKKNKLANAQKASKSASESLQKVRNGVIPKKRYDATLNLGDIVALNTAYAGTALAKKYRAGFSKAPRQDKESFLCRYSIATNAVTALANNPGLLDLYVSFKGISLRPNGPCKGDTKIGDNFFSESLSQPTIC